MLFAGLIRIQSGAILMVADESEFKSLAPFDGVGDGWTTNNKPVILDAREMLQLLQLPDESGLVFFGNFWAEFEENCYPASVR